MVKTALQFLLCAEKLDILLECVTPHKPSLYRRWHCLMCKSFMYKSKEQLTNPIALLTLIHRLQGLQILNFQFAKSLYNPYFSGESLEPSAIKLVTHSETPSAVLGFLLLTVSKDEITCCGKFCCWVRHCFARNAIIPVTMTTSKPVSHLSAAPSTWVCLGWAKGFTKIVEMLWLRNYIVFLSRYRWADWCFTMGLTHCQKRSGGICMCRLAWA